MSFVSPQARQEVMQEKINNILFGDPDSIFDIYTTIKNSLITKLFQNNICVVNNPVNNSEINRFTANCLSNYSTKVKYDANYLMLYGGIAHRMIIYYIKNIYNIYGYEMPSIDMKNYKINDMDLIWWPLTSSNPNELFISKQSTELLNFYEEIKKNIENRFNDNKGFFINKLNQNNINVDENTFKIIVTKSDDLLRGINVITISFLIFNIPYKIIELTIHDGASSQSEWKKQSNGQLVQIIPLKPMSMDPTHSMEIINVDNYENPQANESVVLPSIPLFIKQQIFAYNNLKAMGESSKTKTTTILLRLITLKKLLDHLLQPMQNRPDLQMVLEPEILLALKSSLVLINNFINPSSVQPQLVPISYIQQQPQIFSHYSQSQRQYSQQPQSQYMSHIPPILPPQQQQSYQQPPLPPGPPPRQRGGKTQKKKGHQLFNDNPRGRPRTKGIGYGTAKKARNSITRLKGKSKTYKRQVATTMYYRAKHHKYQNKGMRNAMKVWKKYLNQL
jgi:hypothetical protein